MFDLLGSVSYISPWCEKERGTATPATAPAEYTLSLSPPNGSAPQRRGPRTEIVTHSRCRNAAGHVRCRRKLGGTSALTQPTHLDGVVPVTMTEPPLLR